MRLLFVFDGRQHGANDINHAVHNGKILRESTENKVRVMLGATYFSSHPPLPPPTNLRLQSRPLTSSAACAAERK